MDINSNIDIPKFSSRVHNLKNSSSSGPHLAEEQCHHLHQWLVFPRFHHPHHRCCCWDEKVKYWSWFPGEPCWARICSSAAAVWEWWRGCHPPPRQREVSLGHASKVMATMMLLMVWKRSISPGSLPPRQLAEYSKVYLPWDPELIEVQIISVTYRVAEVSCTNTAADTVSGFDQSLSQKSWWPPACHSRWAKQSEIGECVRTVPSRWRSTWAAWRSWPRTCGSPSTTFSTRGFLSYGSSRPSWSSSEYSSGTSGKNWHFLVLLKLTHMMSYIEFHWMPLQSAARADLVWAWRRLADMQCTRHLPLHVSYIADMIWLIYWYTTISHPFCLSFILSMLQVLFVCIYIIINTNCILFLFCILSMF